jgi:hypothetical protein
VAPIRGRGTESGGGAELGWASVGRTRWRVSAVASSGGESSAFVGYVSSGGKSAR